QPRGADYGNAVHSILEHADFESWRQPDALSDKEKRLLDRSLRKAGYVGPELAQAQAATRRLRARRAQAPCIGSKALLDIGRADRRAELRFHFGIAGAEEKAVLALLHKHGYQQDRRGFPSLRGPLRGLMHGIIDLVCRVDGR